MGYTVPQNLAGVPSVTIRAGTDEMGLPCGVQLTAARGQELAALQLAEIVDRELGFATPPDLDNRGADACLLMGLLTEGF